METIDNSSENNTNNEQTDVTEESEFTKSTERSGLIEDSKLAEEAKATEFTESLIVGYTAGDSTEVKSVQEKKSKKKKNAKKNSTNKKSADKKSAEKNAPLKSRKKIPSTSVQDTVWIEVDVREEKKKQKRAKKAKFKETGDNELVISVFKKNTQGIQTQENFVLESSAKKASKREGYKKQMESPSISPAIVAAIASGILPCVLAGASVKSTIADSIGDIINSAEAENRKNKEKALIKRKAKRILKQERMANIAHCVEISEVYPIVMSASIKEHTLYQHIMEHGLSVANYVRTLFLALEPLHGLSAIWLRRLLLAAQYHDIGTVDDAKSHHKYSYARIKSDLEISIADEDREMVALLARYHRKGMPSKKHVEFVKLSLDEQEQLCKAASLLKIADAIDYGHEGVVKKIDVSIDGSIVTLTCHSPKDLSLEILRILKKSDLFARTFNKEIVCKQA